MPAVGGSASPGDTLAMLFLGMRVDALSVWALPTSSMVFLMLLLHGTTPEVGKLLVQGVLLLNLKSKRISIHLVRKLVCTDL